MADVVERERHEAPADGEDAPSPPALWRIAAPGVVALVVLGLYKLTAASIWIDEACSLAATEQLATTLDRTAGTMATYYVLLNGWIRVSDAMGWVRLLSVITAAGGVLVTAVVGRRIAGARVATWACLFLGGSWMLVRYAQEARSFALVVLVVAAAWLALDHLVDDPTDVRWGAAHIALCVLAPLTHGLAVLAILVQVVAVVAAGVGFRQVARTAIGPAVSALVTGGLYLYGASKIGDWSEPLDWDGVRSVTEGLIAGRVPRWVPSFVPWLVVALTVYGAVVGVLAARRATPGIDRFRAVAPAVWGMGTIAALLALCVVRASVHPRYVIGALPAVALLQAVAALDLQDRLRRSRPSTDRVLRVVPVVPLLLVVVLVLAQVQLHDGHDTSWRKLVQTVVAEAEPGDGLIAPGESRLSVDAEWSQLDAPPPVASIGHHHELGEVIRFDSLVDGYELPLTFSSVDRLWVVWRGGADGVDDFYDGFMRRPLVQSSFVVTETWDFGGVRLELLLPRPNS